jgi:phosphotransferase system HPr (HPr) family protein
VLKEKIKVHLPRGLQARNATEFVRIASSFVSDINIQNQTKLVTGKSLISVMCLAIRKGEEITIIADGTDEKEAVTVLGEFLSVNNT